MCLKQDLSVLTSLALTLQSTCCWGSGATYSLLVLRTHGAPLTRPQHNLLSNTFSPNGQETVKCPLWGDYLKYWSEFILKQTSKVCKSRLRREMLAHPLTDLTHTTNSILLAVSETRSLAESMRCLALTSYGEQSSPKFSIYANSTFNFLQDYPQ